MDRMELEGHWWLPEKPDHRVPGRLVIDDDEIELSLLGALREYIEAGETVVQKGGDTVTTFTEESLARDGVYPRILGQVTSGKYYTLHDCFQTHRSGNYSGAPDRQRINVHSVFEDVHLDYGDLKFSEIVIKLDGLLQFVNRSGFSGNLRTECVDDHRRVLGYTADLEAVPEERFDGLDGSDCRLVYTWTAGPSGVKEWRMAQDFTLRVEFDELKPLDDLLAVAGHFQDLVTVATGRRAAFTSISLRHPELVDQRGDRPPRTVPIEMYAKWIVRPKPGLKPLQLHDVIFNLDELGGVAALTRWLTVADKYAVSLARVMVARYSDSTYVYDSLLNAAAALEGYDRDKHDGGKDVRTNMVVRLKRCIAFAGDPFNDLVPDTDDFAVRLNRHRVNVAHHLNDLKGSGEQEFLGAAAAWLLIICLLRDAEAPQVVFEKVMDRPNWRWLKRHLAEALVPPQDNEGLGPA